MLRLQYETKPGGMLRQLFHTLQLRANGVGLCMLPQGPRYPPDLESQRELLAVLAQRERERGLSTSLKGLSLHGFKVAGQANLQLAVEFSWLSSLQELSQRVPDLDWRPGQRRDLGCRELPAHPAFAHSVCPCQFAHACPVWPDVADSAAAGVSSHHLWPLLACLPRHGSFAATSVLPALPQLCNLAATAPP